MCAVADIALEQTVYNFTEQSGPLQVCINITNNVTVEANFSITVQTDADGGTAQIGDFEIFRKEIIISSGQSCFEIKIFLDAILEGEETFRVSIESTDSALNVVVPQAEVTILDSTSKFLLFSWNKYPYTVIVVMQSLMLHLNRLHTNFPSRANRCKYASTSQTT